MNDFNMNFDHLYSSNPNFYIAGKTDSQIVEAVKNLSRDKKILELGAGQGEIALSIAKEGFEILATDSSTVAVEQIKKKAAELNFHNLKAEVHDMRLGIPKNFDVIVCVRALHYVSRDEGLKLIGQMKKHTNPGGINAVIALTQEGEFYALPGQKDHFYVAQQEMRELYKDWNILEYSEDYDYFKRKNAQGERSKNCRATLIAVKP